MKQYETTPTRREHLLAKDSCSGNKRLSVEIETIIGMLTFKNLKLIWKVIYGDSENEILLKAVE